MILFFFADNKLNVTFSAEELNKKSAVGYLDAHLHLQDKRLQAQLPAVIARARQKGVEQFFCNATSEKDWLVVVELAQTNSDVIPFIGIHPWYADLATEGWEERFCMILEQHSCGVGETGLDKRCPVDFTHQIALFKAQIQLALQYHRPLVVHCVKSWGAVVDTLEQEFTGPGAPPVMLHSYSGSVETMRRLVKAGAYISFSTRLLGRDEARLKQVLVETPVERILLETDSPDQLPPEWMAKEGRTCNEPMWIRDLYHQVAQLKKINVEDLKVSIWENGKIFTHTAASRREWI